MIFTAGSLLSTLNLNQPVKSPLVSIEWRPGKNAVVAGSAFERMALFRSERTGLYR
jgi:hypothetical protein